MKAKFKIGDKVHLVSDPSLVGIIAEKPKILNNSFIYLVFFGGEKSDTYLPENALEAHEGIRNFISAFQNEDFLDRRAFLQHFILEKIRTPLSDNLYTFYASRTDFQVHQFKPVLKMLASVDQRLFIADEVGLGKTIEAGIILTELQARHQGLSRVLIVCPAALLEKWEVELRRRFGEDFRILNRTEFSMFLDRYEKYGDSEEIKAIVSLQSLRKHETLERLEVLQVNFDLIIIDESHHMKNPHTSSSRLGEILTGNADALVMMSATPLHLGTHDLFNQLQILAPSEFKDFIFFERLLEPNEFINAAIKVLHHPQKAAQILRKVEKTYLYQDVSKNPNYEDCISILTKRKKLNTVETIEIQRKLTELNTLSHVFTRTRRQDVSTEINFPKRQAVVIDVEFTENERKLYEDVTEWVIERCQHSTSGIAFAKIMPQRQVSSCIPAMRGYFKNILNNKKIKAPRSDDGDFIDISVDGDDDALAKSEMKTVNRLYAMAKRLGNHDTKFEKFYEALLELLNQNPKSKVIVFSFFKRTLEYLSNQISSRGISNRLIHGDIKVVDRQRSVRKFWSDPKLTVLLSSEVGGEGLDLQIANVIFNYDLPWNPMRVEQRIGRIDRYGQKNEKIFIYNFSMKGTIDEIILERLYKRIDIFERYIGGLEPILGSKINELVHELFELGLSNDERREKVEKVSENLLREQQQLERFEQDSKSFIGQDEYFTREIGNIRETRRFVTADEVRLMLEIFIEQYDPESTLKHTKHGKNSKFVLKASKQFQGLVQAYATEEYEKKEIMQKLTNKHGILLTFDSVEACKDDNLVFVTIHSPIIKSIVKYLDLQTRDQKPVTLPLGRIRLDSYNGLEGNYFLFVFILEKNGIKKQLQLIPILVNLLNSNEYYLNNSVTDLILGKLADAKELNEKIEFTQQQFSTAENVANECISMIREGQENELKRSNEIVLNNRIENIKQTLDVKKSRIQQTIDNMIDESDVDQKVIRMNQGKIEKLEKKAENDINNWEKKRKVSVGFRRIVGCLIKFG